MLPRLLNKIIFIIILLLITSSQVHSSNSWDTNLNSNPINQENRQELELLITGYYSPLPDQKSYITGSYEDEIKLNWDWVWMASGKKVFTGAIAAPKKYPFWTKIYIEWYGVWIVEDRWWSIIDDTHTRIDIWMWYGDEWLQRAKNWWSRKVKWYITNENSEITLNFKSSKEDSYKTLSLNPNSNEDDIKKVQGFFKEIWLYNNEIDWKYESIKPTIIKYQLAKWLISDENDEVAWYFWPKTIAKLSEDFWLVLKNDFAMSKNEKEIILKKIERIKKKLWSEYETKIKEVLKQIKTLKNKNWLNKKTKSILEYLEIML